jgi:hypothetical protein
MKIHVALEWRAICMKIHVALEWRAIYMKIHMALEWRAVHVECGEFRLLVHAMRVTILSRLSRLIMLKFAITYQGWQ